MAKQSQKSEQITQSLEVVYDYDQPMRKTIEFETAFREALGNIEVEKYNNNRVYKYTHNNKDTYFLTGAITWLGNKHPLFKKRLQLKDWYRDFYNEFIHRKNTDVRIVGVYRYEGLHIFVEFNAEDFMDNKLKNSSSHVYINDLCQALQNKYFRKEDKNGNTITTISSKKFKKYIDRVKPKQFYVDNNEIKTAFDFDNELKKDEMKEILEKLLGNRFNNFNNYKKQKILTGCYETEKSEKIFFMVANITFMGGKEGQHPLDLKRIQYNVRWRDFYNDYKEKGKVIWMGIYSYKDLNIFGIFEPETYLDKHKGKNMLRKNGEKSSYSCHIFLNDLYQGYKEGIYKKEDKNKNNIWAVSSNYLKDYLEGKYEEDPIISVIRKINDKIKWNEWIRADEAIPYMRKLESKTGFKNWAQNNWNGWYLEALYSEYLYDKPSKYVEYRETSKNNDVKKEYKEYGLDLAFPNENYKFIGDLKNVCNDNADACLNDESKTKAALKKYNKIWFVIYLHEKKPGKTNNYKMVKWYNHYKKDHDKWPKRTEFNEMSARNTPHSIKMSGMVVVELNEVTEEKYFSIKPQYGKNSDGKPRNYKYYISKKLLKKIEDEKLIKKSYADILLEEIENEKLIKTIENEELLEENENEKLIKEKDIDKLLEEIKNEKLLEKKENKKLIKEFTDDSLVIYREIH